MTLMDALADPAIEATFDDEVRFRSPYADYAGRAVVAHLVGLIRDVLEDVAVVERLHEGPATISVFEGQVEGEAVQGMLFERHDDDRLVDAMLTIRPYAGLRAAFKAMQARMEAAPLPGA